MIKIELVLFLVAINAMHLAHEQTNNTYNAPNYLNDLTTRQNQFKADIQNIKQQIAALNQTLTNSTLTKN